MNTCINNVECKELKNALIAACPHLPQATVPGISVPCLSPYPWLAFIFLVVVVFFTFFPSSPSPFPYYLGLLFWVLDHDLKKHGGQHLTETKQLWSVPGWEITWESHVHHFQFHWWRKVGYKYNKYVILIHLWGREMEMEAYCGYELCNKGWYWA